MTQKNKLKSNPYSGWNVYRRLLKSAAPYWACFVFGIVGTILATGTDAVMVWFIKPLLDSSSTLESRPWWLLWLPMVIVGILILRSISYFLSTYYITSVGRNIVRDFRQRFFAHLMHLPASYYDKETSGKLLSTLIYNTEQVARASTDALLTVLQEGMALLAYTVVMISLSWQLTLMFIVTAPIVTMVIRFVSKRLRRLSTNVQGSMGDLTRVAEEGIENYKVVRVFGGETYEKEKFFAVTHQNRQREMKVVVASTLGTFLTQIITAIPIAVIIFVFTNTQLYVTLGWAGFSAFIVAVLQMLTPLKRLTKINTDIQKGIAGAHSIFALLDEELERDIGTKVIERVKGKIEYKGVSFQYPRSKKTILHNVSFVAEPGQTVALVGVSGGGKSTLVGLLPRFYDVISGQILVDDVNIQDYKLNALRKQFAIVSQHLTLFNDTIANNIAYGLFKDATEDKVARAAEAAHIMDFIKHLPDGLNTMIGENGLLLSGGQRQRIAIARALLKDAPILILDEATSALDSESEYHIQTALENLMKKRTTLVIAHRLSTIEHADKIIVLDHGRVVEVGSHDNLLKLQGQYAKLYNMQFKPKD
ncbi:MAG: lipid A export permease/ATP-binding protein MsbA [Gammaproteobacteria bacterium]|nr:lipid A export permease/ATP-binding protein MsbA [Gammaproteobacteria bacterium]